MILKTITKDIIELTPKEVLFKQKIELISERIISEIPVQLKTLLRIIFLSPQTVSLTLRGVLILFQLEPKDINISVIFPNGIHQSNFILYRLKRQVIL